MLVDMDSALEELGLDKEDFEEFVGDLKSFLEESLPKLKMAAEKSDFDTIRMEAHSIKGACANLRFIHSAECAKKLETLGRERLGDNAIDLFNALEKSLSDSYEELAS